MTSKRNLLREGMWAGDLEDLVLPMVSIDEYESKIDNSATVVGFYVNDKDAAGDLNRFVQKSPFMVLDTEVSPAPDQRGYYFVFVELLINDRIGQNVSDLVKDVSPLVRIDDWQMSLRGVEGVQDFDAELLQKTLIATKQRNEADALVKDAENLGDQIEQVEDAMADVQESVLRFLQPSALLEARFLDDQLLLAGGYCRLSYQFDALVNEDTMVDTITDAVALDPRAISECERLRVMLGEGWIVMRAGERILVQHEDGRAILSLR